MKTDCPDSLSEALRVAVRFLGYRPRSAAEVVRRLETRGFSDQVVQAAIDRMAQQGLVDDERFAQLWIEGRTGSRPVGPARLARELAQRGVERSLAERAIARLYQAERLEQAIDREIRRYWPRLVRSGKNQLRERLVGILARRGYEPWLVEQRLEGVLELIDLDREGRES
ncbi:MAG: RecX family transcriptional regulator [Bacillota bacterium]